MIQLTRYVLFIVTVTSFTNTLYLMECRQRTRPSIENNEQLAESDSIESLLNLLPNAKPWHDDACIQLDEVITKIRAQMPDIESAPAQQSEVAHLLVNKIAELGKLSKYISVVNIGLKQAYREAFGVREIDVNAPCCTTDPCETSRCCLFGLKCWLDAIFAYYYYSYASTQLNTLLNEINQRGSFGNNGQSAHSSREYQAYPSTQQYLAHEWQFLNM